MKYIFSILCFRKREERRENKRKMSRVPLNTELSEPSCDNRGLDPGIYSSEIWLPGNEYDIIRSDETYRESDCEHFSESAHESGYEYSRPISFLPGRGGAYYSPSIEADEPGSPGSSASHKSQDSTSTNISQQTLSTCMHLPFDDPDIYFELDAVVPQFHKKCSKCGQVQMKKYLSENVNRPIHFIYEELDLQEVGSDYLDVESMKSGSAQNDRVSIYYIEPKAKRSHSKRKGSKKHVPKTALSNVGEYGSVDEESGEMHAKSDKPKEGEAEGKEQKDLGPGDTPNYLTLLASGQGQDDNYAYTYGYHLRQGQDGADPQGQVGCENEADGGGPKGNVGKGPHGSQTLNNERPQQLRQHSKGVQMTRNRYEPLDPRKMSVKNYATLQKNIPNGNKDEYSLENDTLEYSGEYEKERPAMIFGKTENEPEYFLYDSQQMPGHRVPKDIEMNMASKDTKTLRRYPSVLSQNSTDQSPTTVYTCEGKPVSVEDGSRFYALYDREVEVGAPDLDDYTYTYQHFNRKS
jgi:hypothetical protein